MCVNVVVAIKNHILKFLRFFALVKSLLWRYTVKTTIFTVNYSADHFSENIYTSKPKFKLVIFLLIICVDTEIICSLLWDNGNFSN